jgi:WD40 repeat protein/transcriptional regulator with XRE-family HTH domain
MEMRLPWHVILKRERQMRGLSQQNVADALECDLKTVGRWERNKAKPDAYHSKRLMTLFQKSALELGLMAEETSTDKRASQVTSSSSSSSSSSESISTHISHDLVALRQDMPPLDERQERVHILRELGEDRLSISAQEHFYGRETELALMEQWIAVDRCQMIAVFGLGGAGKTTFVQKVVERIQASFEHVIWFSLHNIPQLESLTENCLRFLLRSEHVEHTGTLDERISLVHKLLGEQRCLLVLDNLDSLLQGGQRAGHYLTGYEGYGKLLRRIAETRHQSCLLLTSREKPREVALIEGNTALVRSFRLPGLQAIDGQYLLQERGLSGSDEAWTRLVEHYSGNPLALKLVSGTVRELFAGDVAAFLQEGEIVFGDIYALMEQQFSRLSPVEQELMFWLAIEREPLSIKNLHEDLAHPIAKGDILDALASLCERAMIEVRTDHRFLLQSVIMEYVTKYLVGCISMWIRSEDIVHLGKYPLIKAQTSDYIRESQIHFILAPVAEKLIITDGESDSIQKLRLVLTKLRGGWSQVPVYAAGNILNLLMYLQADLRGIDCSNLTIREANFSAVELPGANFAHAALTHCLFKSTFTWILCLAVSADGTLLAAGTTTGELRIWHVVDAAPILTCVGHSDEIRAVAFSPDGQRIASGSEDHTIRIWDVATGVCRHTFHHHTDMLRAVAFSADGRIVAGGSEDQTISLWDSATGQLLYVLQGHTDRVRAIAFHPTRPVLASGGDDLTVRIWDCVTGSSFATLNGHTAGVRAVVFSPDGALLASGSEDRTAHVWNTQTWERQSVLRGHTDRVRTMAFSPDNHALITGSDDHTLRFWDVASAQATSVIRGHTNRIWSLVCVPGKQLLISASEDDTLRWWDMHSGYCLRTLQGYTDLIKAVAFAPDGKVVVSASEDQTVRVWDVQSGRCLNVLRGHANRVRAVALSPDGALVASGSEDETVRIWDIQTGRCLKILRGHTHLVRSVAFDPTGRWLLSGSHDQTLRLWNVRSGHLQRVLQPQQGLIWSVAFHPGGEIVACGGDDPAVSLWNIYTGEQVQTFSGHTRRLWSLAFSVDGTMLATASDDLTLRVCSVIDGQCLSIIQGHDGWTRSIAFSPDGALVASTSFDLTVRLWDVHSGRCIRILQGHEGWIWSVAFSPDGKTLASGGDDGAIKFWDRDTGVCVRTLRRDRPYEKMNIAGLKGVSEAQKDELYFFGAV